MTMKNQKKNINWSMLFVFQFQPCLAFCRHRQSSGGKYRIEIFHLFEIFQKIKQIDEALLLSFFSLVMKYFVSQRAPWTMDNLPDVAVGQNYQLCWPDPAPDTAIILTISVSPDQKDIQIKKNYCIYNFASVKVVFYK